MLFQTAKTFVAASCVLATTTIRSMKADEPHLLAVGALSLRAEHTVEKKIPYETVEEFPEEEDKCPICLEEDKDADVVKTPCGHHFHKKCLAKWLEKAKTCPNCRRVIADDKPKVKVQNPDQIVTDFFEGRLTLKQLLEWGNQLERMEDVDEDLVTDTNEMIRDMEANDPSKDEDRLIVAFGMFAAGPDLGFDNVSTHGFQNYARGHLEGPDGGVKEDLKARAAAIVERWCVFHS